MEYLYYAQLVFTVLMAVDAYNRGAEYYWIWIIIIFQPLGPWIYLFAVRGRDLSLPAWLSFQRRPSLDQLRYQVHHTPTLASHLALAERLIEWKEFDEACEHLLAAQKREPEHCQVAYLLAACYTETGRLDEARILVDKIIERERRWSDYAAWRLLVQLRVKLNDPTGALEAAREMARLSPTLQHRCILAERLMAEGKNDEARAVIDESLADYRYAPGPIRRKNRQWASQAKRLQRLL